MKKTRKNKARNITKRGRRKNRTGKKWDVKKRSIRTGKKRSIRKKRTGKKRSIRNKRSRTNWKKGKRRIAGEWQVGGSVKAKAKNIIATVDQCKGDINKCNIPYKDAQNFTSAFKAERLLWPKSDCGAVEEYIFPSLWNDDEKKKVCERFDNCKAGTGWLNNNVTCSWDIVKEIIKEDEVAEVVAPRLHQKIETGPFCGEHDDDEACQDGLGKGGYGCKWHEDDGTGVCKQIPFS
jgi:hypothetical protein